MRSHLARAIVLWASEALDKAYWCWCAKDASVTDFERRYYQGLERYFAWHARWRGRLLPLAAWLDHHAAIEEMANASWWG